MAAVKAALADAAELIGGELAEMGLAVCWQPVEGGPWEPVTEPLEDVILGIG